MAVHQLDDADDPRLAPYCLVPDAELLRTHGLFVAEGRQVVRRLLATPRLAVRSVLVTDTAYAALADDLARRDLSILVIPQAVMNGVVGFNIHRGCLALAERPPRSEWSPLAASARRLLVLERVGDADNVGALFRHAAAFGVDAVLTGPACADPLYRKAIRTSMGHALTIPFASIAPWPEALTMLAGDGVSVIGLTPAADAMPLPQAIAHAGETRIALVVGHEGAGLTAEALRACTHLARIPMAARVDSLNVATAAAIALYELTRATYTER